MFSVVETYRFIAVPVPTLVKVSVLFPVPYLVPVSDPNPETDPDDI